MKVAILTLLAALVSAQTPIPARPRGYMYLNSSDPKVVIEVFYDHLCDGSKANWPVLQQLHRDFSKSNGEVALLIHIFPLPYHHNAYFVQQAGEVVRMDSDCFIDYVDAMFASQDDFLSGAENMTEPQVKESIAKFSQVHCNIPSTRTTSGFDDAVIVRKSRYAWKYAASRSITGTPQFIINGVIDPKASEYSADDWHKMIQSLLNEK